MERLLTTKREWEKKKESKRYSLNFYQRNMDLRTNKINLLINLFINEMLEKGIKKSKSELIDIDEVKNKLKGERLVVLNIDLRWGSYLLGCIESGKVKKFIGLGMDDNINNKLKRFFEERNPEVEIEIYKMTEEEFKKDKDLIKKYQGQIDIILK